MTTPGTPDDTDLVLHRTYTASIGDVWAAITESERLARWYGTWTGDPTAGWVMLTMNAEAEEVPPTRCDITECTPPHRLLIEFVDEVRWRIAVDLAETDGVTTLRFVQHDVTPESSHDLAAGWAWYLDRLTSCLDGTPAPTLDDFDATYRDA